MKVLGVIPARMGSSRFPGKPLTPILGRPMIEIIHERCARAAGLDDLVIATCDDAIMDAAKAFGAEAVMTSAAHERATDRMAEVARRRDADVYVLIQGDEPLTTPGMIDAALAPFATDPSVACVNLMRRIESEADFLNPDTIKVVTGPTGDALYMSRSPVPSPAKGGFANLAAFKQVCIIPMTAALLGDYADMAPTPLEVAESVDMLRLIENGIGVRMVETEVDSHAVDRPSDVARVEALLRAEAAAAESADA